MKHNNPARPCGGWAAVTAGNRTRKDGVPSVPAARDAQRGAPSLGRRGGLIEIDLPGGRRVRVDAQFDAEAVSRVLDLLERR